MVEVRHHNPDGREWTTSHTYDAGGLLREIETCDGTGPVSKSIYYYDSIGHIERVVARAADGTENTVQTFTYDEQHKTHTQHFHPAPGRLGAGVMYSIEGSDAAVSAPGATSMTTVYDDHDRPVETLFHDSQRRILSRVTLHYDDAGRVVEESQTTEMEEALPTEMLDQLNPAQLQSIKAVFGLGEGRQKWTRVHRYDDEGRRIETVFHFGTLGGERKTMAYNDHGDLSEEKSYRARNELSFDDQGRVVEGKEPSPGEAPTAEARFYHQYDEHGNWIERSGATRSQSDKPFVQCSVERRSLTYHRA
jgi:hypothetical protein